jgi:hypothetical protein
MDELARRFAFVADDRRFGIEVREAPQAAASQGDTDGGDRPAQTPRNGRAGEALAAEVLDLVSGRAGQPTGAVVRLCRAIGQACGALGGVPVAPFAHGFGGYAQRNCGRGDRSALGQALHDQHSTMRWGSGVLMDVHPGLRACGCWRGNHRLHLQPRRDNVLGNYS